MSSEHRRFGILSSDAQKEYEEKQKTKSSVYQPTIVLPDGFSFFKLPTDRDYARIDILPFVAKTEHGEVALGYYNYQVHRNIGPNNATIVCPGTRPGKSCPVCEYLRTLNWNDPEDEQTIRKYRIQKRQLYAVIWLDNPDQETKHQIQIFDTSVFGFGDIVQAKLRSRDLSDPDEAGWDNYFDLLDGFSIKLSITDKNYGKGSSSTYRAVSSIEFKPRIEQYTEDYYDKVPDLTKCLHIMDYNTISAMFGNGLSGRGEKRGRDDFDMLNGNNPLVKPNEKIAPDPIVHKPVSARQDFESDDNSTF